MDYLKIADHLKTKKVGIAGCGGLGSNCAHALARSGIGRLLLVDFDRVDRSNLNRQFYFPEQIGLKKAFELKKNLHSIRHDIEIKAIDKKLSAEDIPIFFSDCDIVVEAFDKAESKCSIIESMSKYLPEIPLIVGNGMAGWGNNNSIHQRNSGNLYICGDEKSEVKEDLPALAPRVGIVAYMQANLVLELLLKDIR